MCNLYSSTTAQEAMRRMFGVEPELDHLGNFEPLGAIWPKYRAPVVRLSEDGTRELVSMSWGFLTPKVSKKTGKTLKPEAWNNARDDKLLRAPLWRDSFAHRRCLIPATSFREAKGRNPARDYWFAMSGDADRPAFAFAGIWRDGQPGVGGDDGKLTTHSMVTTTANDLVRPVHPTRMPVILDPMDYDTWLTGAPDVAQSLLKPWPSDRMRIVKEGVGILSDNVAV